MRRAAQTRQHLGRHERPGDEIACSQLQGLDSLLGSGQIGIKQYRNRLRGAIPLQPADQLQPAVSGQPQLSQDQVRLEHRDRTEL